MVSKVLLVSAILVLTALASEAAYSPYTPAPKENNCQCMPYNHCDGKINSNIQCHPSYVMVCCIRPKPETVPPYIPENIKSEDIQVIQV